MSQDEIKNKDEDKKEDLEEEENETSDDIQKEEEEETRSPFQEELEKKARRGGWVPEEEFKGDKSKWIDAKTFVDKGERELPLLKSAVRRAEETNKYLKDHVKKQSDKIKVLSEQVLKQREYELSKRENIAVEESDLQEMDRIRKEREEYYKTKTQLEQEELSQKKEEEQKNIIPQEVIDWVQQNPWFKQDVKKNAYAIAVYNQAKKDNPYISESEALAEVDREMNEVFFKKRIPSKTSVMKARNTALGTTNKSKKFIRDLAPKEQEIARNLIRDGVFQNEEEYMKEYELLD